MKVKLQTNPDQLIIYRGKTSTILFIVLMAVACLGFGVLFIYVGLQEARSAFLVFGGVFGLAALFILAGLPKLLAKINKENGAVVLMATKQGLWITHLLGMEAVSYQWSDIARISLTKKLVTVDHDESQWSWNRLLIYLREGSVRKNTKGFVERFKSQLSTSPKGENLIFLGFPKEQMYFIRDQLIQLSSKAFEISVYEAIKFNYKKKTEEFQKNINNA